MGRPKVADCGESFSNGDDQAQTAALVVDLVARRIPQKLGVAPTDIQVLSPLRRNGEAAANALNTALQAALNPPRRGVAECRVGERTFRVGDRVIQTKNDYTRRVFNGETGQVVAIDTENRQLVVAFDDMVADYAFDDLDNIDLAYALTVHKSQGSEYPVVIIPVVSAHYIMLKRNLLYTGVTRARQVVVLVGQRKAVSLAVSEGRREKRFSGLKWRLGVEK
jgi:exodeoxyribonuclease V alpha subunit